MFVNELSKNNTISFELLGALISPILASKPLLTRLSISFSSEYFPVSIVYDVSLEDSNKDSLLFVVVISKESFLLGRCN